MRTIRYCLLISLVMAPLTTSTSSSPAPAFQKKLPMSAGDVDAIAALLRLEDTRSLDEATLKSLLDPTRHPEVRRRAIQSIGRINDPRGKALLESLHRETDPEILATVALSTGQLKDGAAVSWLTTVMSGATTALTAIPAQEAARSLGKIRGPEARAALLKYLKEAPTTTIAAPVVGEALLSAGRFTGASDLAPIVQWTTSQNVEIRWRATWALFRLRDPAAIPHLMTLASDRSGDVRHWALRGLAASVVDQSTVSRATASAKLREAIAKDSDRRAKTEAVRALKEYDDDESFKVLLEAIHSPDNWVGTSAAEAMSRFPKKSSDIVPELIAATRSLRPTSLRLISLGPLETMAREVAREAARGLESSDSPFAKMRATQLLQRLGQQTLNATQTVPAGAGAAGGGRAAGNAGAAAGGGDEGRGRASQPERPARPEADYRRLVEEYIVPAWNGAPNPRVVWETPRGQIEFELYAADAPFGVEQLMKDMSSGAIVGKEFTRLVPNFVAQMERVSSGPPLRDEVSRRGLTKGNLSWASNGLDTGRPAYTIATEPHPHIEGDFTALGGVVSGMAAADRLEWTDRIIAARVKK
jgi:peptidyl-prolyl cis-trans isomerase B (cyclophilin B)